MIQYPGIGRIADCHAEGENHRHPADTAAPTMMDSARSVLRRARSAARTASRIAKPLDPIDQTSSGDPAGKDKNDP